MKPATALATALLVAGTTTLLAQTAGDRPGRYSMSPADGGGFARLDTQTGAMSLCQRAEGAWTCTEMADAARARSQENDKLRSENQRLRAEIRQMEEIILGDKMPGNRRAEADRPAGQGPGEKHGQGPGLRLPTEAEVDQAMSYVQRMLRKLREKWKELEAEGKGTSL
jgi:hypothetical protein